MTEGAEKNHMKVEAHMKRMDEGMLRGMSEKDVKELTRLLAVIMDNLETMEEEFTPEGAEEVAKAEEKS